MAPHAHVVPDFNRRRFLQGVGVAAALSAVSPTLLASPAEAAHRSRKPWPTDPIPSPIPGQIDSEDPNVGFIHWWLPGPEGLSTPVLGLPGFGLDVDPSTMTNFNGFQAFAVLSGTTTRNDGGTHPTEFDVRIFQGEYVVEDGSKHYGTFGFF